MKDGNFYNEDYFESGKIKGLSCYTHYHWIPRRSLKEAKLIAIQAKLKPHDKILDFGCAKGFLVKALNLLGFDAYGCDISSYAISNSDLQIRDKCRLISAGKLIPWKIKFDLITAILVLEHLGKSYIQVYLKEFEHKANKVFIRVPLGIGGQYIHPKEAKDKSHMIAESELWWIDQFKQANLSILDIQGLHRNGLRYESSFLLTTKEAS